MEVLRPVTHLFQIIVNPGSLRLGLAIRLNGVSVITFRLKTKNIFTVPPVQLSIVLVRRFFYVRH